VEICEKSHALHGNPGNVGIQRKVVMEFATIYNNTAKYFPDTIDVSDGVFFADSDGFLSKNLSEIWNNAEEKAETEWEALMVWILYQNVHAMAKVKSKAKEGVVVIRDINTEVVETDYFEALKEEGYEKLMEEYKR
jgi:hypothetical protein